MNKIKVTRYDLLASDKPCLTYQKYVVGEFVACNHMYVWVYPVTFVFG